MTAATSQLVHSVEEVDPAPITMLPMQAQGLMGYRDSDPIGDEFGMDGALGALLLCHVSNLVINFSLNSATNKTART
eukprot:SAG31_NODE_776_length_12175_cov_9.349122_5_plen_77_part_00